MDLRTRLKKPSALRFAETIATELSGDDVTKIDEVFDLIFDNDSAVAWRAAWVCEKIQEKNKLIFGTVHWQRLVPLVLSSDHFGTVRGCLSIMLGIEVPLPISVEMVNFCFEAMLSPRYPVAVQALSMKILLKICKVEPAFVSEFRASLESCELSFYSPGFISTRKNVLSALKTIGQID